MKLSIPMTRGEIFFGWLLLLCQLMVFPIIALTINSLLATPLSNTVLNCLLFIAEFLFVIHIFHKFMMASIRKALQKPLRCILFAIAGLLIYYLGSAAVGLLITYLSPDFANVNDNTVYEMLQDQYYLILICTSLLAPVTEEILYRGLIFRPLEKKNRFLAYGVSVTVFALIHVVGYIGTVSTGTLALCFLQYIPAGFALAWAYKKSDTICTPILMHMTVNFVSVSLMRYL